jgi:polypeptide N-acetylgalactosaminyltransferase
MKLKDVSEPISSPTMPGGLFSIDKAFFERLGYYDPGFEIWY